MADRRELYVAKFEGGLADEHKLPAYEAAQSLYGISRSLTIVTNYLIEGRVRRRDFERQPYEINFLTQRRGSFETVFEIITDPTIMAAVGGTITAGVAGNLLTDLIKAMFRRSIGQDAPASIERMESSEILKAGDLGAVIDALEPAMRDIHRPIGKSGVSKIVIVSGDNNSVIFNDRSKQYVNSAIDDDRLRSRLFSVASFNANTGYGRVYDTDEQRTIPFQLPRGIDRPSVNKILESMASYTRFRWVGANEKSAVAFLYTRRLSVDERVKMIFPQKVRAELSDL